MWTGFDTLVLWQVLEGVWDLSVSVWCMAMCGKVMDILDHGTAGKKATVGQMCPFWSGLKGLLSLKAGKLCLNAVASGRQWAQNLSRFLQCEHRFPWPGLQRSTGIAREASSLSWMLPTAQGLEKALTLLSLPTLELLWTGLTLHVLLVSCWRLCPASVDMLSKGILSHTW